MKRPEAMSKHLTDSELERYHARTLPPQALLAVNAHLYDCGICHERYGGDEKIEAASAFVQSIKESGEEDSHLPFEQLAMYVDDALDAEEKRQAAAHLELCGLCAEQVHDLQPLRELIAPVPEAATAPPLVSGARPSFFGNLRAAWRAPAYRNSAVVVGVALLILLLSWFLVRSLRTERTDRRVEAPKPTSETGESSVGGGVSQAEGGQVQTIQPDISPDEHSSETPPPGIPPEAVSPDGNSLPASSQSTPLDKSAPVLITLQDARSSVTLYAGGGVEGLDSADQAQQILVRRVLTTASVVTPRMPWKDGRGEDTLMGGPGSGGSFSLLSPVNKVVRSVRPFFRWAPLEGAVSYVVTVRDSRGRTVAMSGPLSAAEWSVSQSLSRGVIYSWKVLAVKDGQEVVAPPPTAPDARFKILEEIQAEELTRAEQLQPRSHLLLGALYAKAGLLDEAEREFQKLLENNPESPVARKLLQSVRK